MWFSNLICYRFKQDVDYSQEDFEKALENDAFRPCGQQELSSFGWTKALGKNADQLSHFSDKNILVCAKREERILPAAVINEMLAEKVDQIEQAENRKLKKQEKDELKENLIHTLLPQAFKKSSLQFAFINLEAGWLIVNSASFNKAEELLALLRKSLGTLPVVPVFAQFNLALHLTDWLKNLTLPEGFSIGNDAQLLDAADDSAQVNFKNHDLLSEEVKQHLDSGKIVAKLALDWRERLKLVLQADGSIKRVNYADMLKEQIADLPKEELLLKLDADFIICAAELSQLLLELSQAMDSAEQTQSE